MIRGQGVCLQNQLEVSQHGSRQQQGPTRHMAHQAPRCHDGTATTMRDADHPRARSAHVLRRTPWTSKDCVPTMFLCARGVGKCRTQIKGREPPPRGNKHPKESHRQPGKPKPTETSGETDAIGRPLVDKADLPTYVIASMCACVPIPLAVCHADGRWAARRAQHSCVCLASGAFTDCGQGAACQ